MTGPDDMFHSLPDYAFPFTVRYRLRSTRETVWEVTVEEEGAIELPDRDKFPGPVGVEMEFAHGLFIDIDGNMRDGAGSLGNAHDHLE